MIVSCLHDLGGSSDNEELQEIADHTPYGDQRLRRHRLWSDLDRFVGLLDICDVLSYSEMKILFFFIYLFSFLFGSICKKSKSILNYNSIIKIKNYN